MEKDKCNLLTLSYTVYLKHRRKNRIWRKLNNLFYHVHEVFNIAYDNYKLNFIYKNRWLNILYPENSNLPKSERKDLYADIDSRFKKFFFSYDNFKGNKKTDKKTHEVIDPTGKNIDSIVYKELTSNFKDFPSSVIQTIDREAGKAFKHDLKNGLLNGSRSSRSYRKGCPLPVNKSNIKFKFDDKNKPEMVWNFRSGEEIIFGFSFGVDKNRYSQNLIRMIQEIESNKNDSNKNDSNKNGSNKNISYGNIKLLKNKKNHLEVRIPVFYPKQENKLDESICMGVDVGFHNLIVCGFNKESIKNRLRLGNFKNDVLRDSNRVKAQIKRIQSGIKLHKGGHGKNKKLKSLNNISDKEHNTTKNTIFMIAKRCVDFAIKFGAGIVKLEFLKGITQQDKSNYFLKKWPYYMLQKRIEQLCVKNGIVIKYIDPYQTSKTCSKCGYINETLTVKDRFWVCPECGERHERDYNASVIISRSENYVDKIEDCQYYKKYNKKKSIKSA